MKKAIKKKYIPCEIIITEFSVERGFATSTDPNHASFYGAFATGVNTNTWTMNKNQTSNEYQNEKYSGGIDWFTNDGQ